MRLLKIAFDDVNEELPLSKFSFEYLQGMVDSLVVIGPDAFSKHQVNVIKKIQSWLLNMLLMF